WRACCRRCDRFDYTTWALISYLKLSASRLSTGPSAVSACGYIRNGRCFSADAPGSATSCAKLYAIQFISHDPNSRVRALCTIVSAIGRFPGGSSSITFRTSAGSTGTQPWPERKTSARQCCAFVTTSDDVPRLLYPSSDGAIRIP